MALTNCESRSAALPWKIASLAVGPADCWFKRPGMNNSETSPTFQASCRHLRNKEMHYQAYGQEDDEFASGIHWCGKTQEAFGPDGQEAGKTQCCAGRGCYVD